MSRACVVAELVFPSPAAVQAWLAARLSFDGIVEIFDGELTPASVRDVLDEHVDCGRFLRVGAQGTTVTLDACVDDDWSTEWLPRAYGLCHAAATLGASVLLVGADDASVEPTVLTSIGGSLVPAGTRSRGKRAAQLDGVTRLVARLDVLADDRGRSSLAPELGGRRTKTPPKGSTGSRSIDVLAKKAEWGRAEVNALLVEHGADAVARVVPLLQTRDLTDPIVAHRTLAVLLLQLTFARIDVTPLVPTLERIVTRADWNPDGKRKFETVRVHALRLLCRLQNPAGHATVERLLRAFPEPLDGTTAASLLFVLAECAADLRDHALGPLFTPLLDALLVRQPKAKREVHVAPVRAIVARLGATR